MPALYAQNAGNTAVGVAAATICTIPVAKPGPGAVARGFIPQVTAVPTLATVTAQIIRTDTGAVIASGTATNGAASAQPVGPIEAQGPVPANLAAGAGLSLQVLGSAAAGNAVGTANAPCFLLEEDTDYIPG